jgi:glutamyl-tRNA synthetase
VLPNVIIARDVQAWLPVVFGGELEIEPAARAAMQEAGAGFFSAAATAAGAGGDLEALRAATGRKGAQFYAPLRAALTGRLKGPELKPLLRAMSPGLLTERLVAAQRS